MSKKQASSRILALSLAMLLVAGALVLRLVYLQLVKGEEYRSSAARQTSVRYTETAARGEIFDRNGKLLVSNALRYVIRFDYYNWERARQNEVILGVCALLDEAGIAHYDSLPLTQGYPFEYTYSSLESGDGRKLANYIKNKTKLTELPTAGELFEYLCTKFEVDRTLPLDQQRLLVGVRYEMVITDFGAYAQFTLASDLDIETAAHVVQLSSQFPGVVLDVENSRKYEVSVASHILGRVGIIYAEEYAELKDKGYGMTAILGKDGMEKALEGYLRGIDGKRTVEADIRGNITNEYISEEPKPGKNCILTIDIALQEVAEKALADTIESIRKTGQASSKKQGADAEGGAVVVLSVATGEVLAMASYPTYNLATFTADYNALRVDALTPMLNRAIQGVYPPGSTFKMATAVAALEEKVVTPTTKIRDQGIYTYWDDYQPRCWIFRDRGVTHGNINISEALKYSCNYFFFEVSRIMGIETLNKYASALGLGKRTGIELYGEEPGKLASPETVKDWQGGLVLQAAIGQSAQQFTPIQLANYVATILNGGERHQPYLLKEVRDYTTGELVMETEPKVLDSIALSQSTIDAIKLGMKGVVTEDGTASSVFYGYPIALGGKTGSAQTRTGRSAHGVFVAFAPYDNPEIVVCAVGEYAGSGGAVAPVAVAIFDQYFGLNQPAEEEAPPEGTENPAREETLPD